VIANAWRQLKTRRPWVRWLAKWGLSLVSLASGILTLSLFRRGLEYFPWVVGYLLLLWLAGVVFAEAREALEARGRRLLRAAYDYTLQSLCWHLLLFLLPIYFVSTTLSSPNVLFLGTLGAATLLTAVDPWYRATVLRIRWASALMFAYAMFVTLVVALPLIGVRSGGALILAAAASMLALAPTARRSFRLSWRTASLAAVLAGVCAALLVWLARAWIPPVPLHLVRGTLKRGNDQNRCKHADVLSVPDTRDRPAARLPVTALTAVRIPPVHGADQRGDPWPIRRSAAPGAESVR